MDFFNSTFFIDGQLTVLVLSYGYSPNRGSQLSVFMEVQFYRYYVGVLLAGAGTYRPWRRHVGLVAREANMG